jgi:hypothetical protein
MPLLESARSLFGVAPPSSTPLLHYSILERSTRLLYLRFTTACMSLTQCHRLVCAFLTRSKNYFRLMLSEVYGNTWCAGHIQSARRAFFTRSIKENWTSCVSAIRVGLIHPRLTLSRTPVTGLETISSASRICGWIAARRCESWILGAARDSFSISANSSATTPSGWIAIPTHCFAERPSC